MKYFAAIPLIAGLASAQMAVMSMQAAASGGPVTHTVSVGGAKAPANPTGTPTPQLLFNPESIQANPGDMVEFRFLAKNHSVTQSTFATPCVKKQGGADSDFKPNANNSPNVSFQVPVENTEPMWFYCKQKVGTHCGTGMVFAVNAATSGNSTFDKYKQLAVKQNGTALGQDALIAGGAQAAASPSTVTMKAGGGGGAGGAGGASKTGSASMAQGTGTNGNGESCSCSCLCSPNSFAGMPMDSFGGFPGMMNM